MSKLSFRARALDPSKPMPIYLAEEIPDLPEYSAINRAVPQMPSGMEKEEESVSCQIFILYFQIILFMLLPLIFWNLQSFREYFPLIFDDDLDIIHVNNLFRS